MHSNTMFYTLCISPSCPSCEKIIKMLRKMKIKPNVKNVELDQSCDVSIIPALFYGDKLLAYGKDIVYYFKNKNESEVKAIGEKVNPV